MDSSLQYMCKILNGSVDIEDVTHLKIIFDAKHTTGCAEKK